MNLHLRELLSKKLRIELEIKNLKKSIAEKQLHVKKQVKVKAVIESVEFPLSEQQTQQLLLEDPDLYFILREIDFTEKALKEILDQFSENQ